jgi:hypothetical protein
LVGERAALGLVDREADRDLLGHRQVMEWAALVRTNLVRRTRVTLLLIGFAATNNGILVRDFLALSVQKRVPKRAIGGFCSLKSGPFQSTCICSTWNTRSLTYRNRIHTPPAWPRPMFHVEH